jgi:hypothetical protein
MLRNAFVFFKEMIIILNALLLSAPSKDGPSLANEREALKR